MALLYRSNAQSRVLEHALFNAGIAYRVYGGLRFFERQEIKHALAYLRLIANPEDDGAMLRVINFPTRGIGNRTLEQLQAGAMNSGSSLWQSACSNPPSGRAGSAIAAFVRLIEDMNLEELVNAAASFVSEEGLATYEADSANAPSTEADAQAEALDPLSAFLAHASLEAGENQAAAGADALQLMTVHSAKGLEFHTVFISGLEEGLFPHENSLNEEGGLEEERRLMYVAMTRARRRLYLSHTQTRMLHGQTRYNVASRFLDEVPQELLKRLGAAVPSFAPAVAPGQSGSRIRGKPVMVGGFRVGQSVLHPKFGSGVIVQAEGSGSDARVQVNFRDDGLKWLALEYAKLAPA